MNFKTTLILLVLVAVVAGYFVLFEQGRPTTHDYQQQRLENPDPEGQPLFDGLAADDVTRLTIQRRGQAPAALAKIDGNWMQVEPVRFPLNATSPANLVDKLVALRAIDAFAPAADEADEQAPTLADLSLQSPRVSVVIETRDGSHTVHLGERSAGGRGFLMVDGDPDVYVVSDAVHTTLLDTPIESWRRKSFEVATLSQFDALSLRHGGQEIAARKIDGRWFLDDPGTERASESELSSIVDAVQSMYVQKFVTDAPPNLNVYGLDQPRLELSLRRPAIDDGEPRRQTLRIGSAADLEEQTYYATWSSPQTATGDEPSTAVFTLRKDVLDSLTQSTDDLRDPKLVVTQADDVREIRLLRRDLDDLTFQQTPQGWAFGEPSPDFQLDHQAARDLLKTITSAEADGYEASVQPDEQPAVTVELYRSGESAPERLAIHGPRGSGDQTTYLALRDGERVGYIVADEAVAPLLAPASLLRDKTLIQAAADEISRLELTQPDGTLLTFVRDAEGDGDWQLQGHDGFESSALTTLTRELAPLEAESWTTTLQSFQPDVTLAVTMRDQRTHSLQVETASRRAMMEDLPMFAVPESLIDAVTAEFRPRLALPLTIERIASVTIAGPDAEVTLQRDAEGQYTDGDGQRPDVSEAAGVFDRLAGLRVERWLAGASVDPDVTLTITTTDDQTRTLTLNRQTRTARFADDDRVFRLREADVASLTAPLADDKSGDDGDDDEE